MGAVYPLFQHLQPPIDGSEPCDPNTQPAIQDSVGMNLYGTLSLGPWEQWLSTENAAFADTAHIAATDAFALEHQQQYVQFAYDQESPTQWASPSTPMHGYPIPSPSTESTSVENATGDPGGRRGSSSTQPDKRKRNAVQPTASKAPKRSRTKQEAVSGKPKGRRKGKAVAKPQPTKKYPSAEQEEKLDEHSKKAKERNRIASNKFRVKKREEAQKLRADEQEMERTNHQLSGCVSELTTQVYDLKMELLRHTNCECRLIQNYIANEAHRYIQDLGAGKVQHATPPLCPYNQHS
ncbi:uncharacterized protein FFNC_15575 [Fusarium fujikuroi]|nr:uncharacterized protein FFNC_15575 [Fusarium fujikuroi]